MSANGTVEIVWSHGKDHFCLKIGQILDLEEKCKAGLATVMKRLENREWYVNDVIEPIRLGLIGAGKTPAEAQDIVERHVQPPLAQFVIVAYEIVLSALVPPRTLEQPGKDQADRDQAPESTSSSQMDDSPGSPSTSSVPDSDGNHEKSMTQHSGNSQFTLTDGTRLMELEPGL